MITYIDENEIKMLNDNTLETSLLTIENGSLSDESIQAISILYKNPEKGFARQNDLVPKKWVNIFFGGDMPTTITGEITNLEEDMIEITSYPDGDKLYIDFAYKGYSTELTYYKY